MDKPFALVVEDERDIAALYRHILDVAGYRTEIALHGQVAAERLSKSQPDLVILDLNLPGVSGAKILAMIQQDERLKNTKVIVITAHAHMASGLLIIPDLLLLKPVSIEQLRAFVSRIKLSKKAVPLLQKPFDDYTDLYNQPFFVNRLESALKQAKEINPYLFGVFLFKLNPKSQTENKIWESTLHEISGALKSILRPTDTLARFDQDNFYLLIENIPNGELSVAIANRIQERLYRNIADIENKIQVPIRIGILLCDSGYKNVDQILSDAKYAQTLAVAQGDEYSKYYYQFSVKK